MMFVCEARFQNPDPDDPDYSWLQIQFYAFTPRNTQEGTDGIPNHRLFLRKNLRTNRFELVRQFQVHSKSTAGPFTMTTNIETGREEVALSLTSLHDSLLAGDDEYFRMFGKRDLQDGMCVHRWPYKDELCPYRSKLRRAVRALRDIFLTT